MIRVALACLVLVFVHSLAFAYSGKVVAVQEGDRLTMLHNGKKLTVQLYGIDAPELKQPYGNEARTFLDAFTKEETVEVEPVGAVKKGSLTGMAFLGSDNINELLLLKGQAWVDRARCTTDICAKWIKMEEAAKATQKGLWSDPQAMPPWEFRAQNAPKPATKPAGKKSAKQQ